MRRFNVVKSRREKNAVIRAKTGICRDETGKTAADGGINDGGTGRKMKFCAFRYCKNFTPAI